MTHLFDDLKLRMSRHAAYRRCLRELRDMSPAVAQDLDIDPADAKRIAHRAVYGR